MGELIEVYSRPEVPADYGKQNSFYARIEGQIANSE